MPARTGFDTCLAALAITLLVSISACSDPAGSDPTELSSVAGLYQLVSVNDASLPVGGPVSLCCSNTILSGTLLLDSSDTYEVTTRFRSSAFGVPDEGTSTITGNGAYGLTSSSAIVFSSSGVSVDGTITGEEITTTNRLVGVFVSRRVVDVVYRKTSLIADNTAAAIEVWPAGDTLLAFGARLQMHASADNQSGHPLGDKIFDWESSDTGVVAIDDSGLATAMSNGTVTIAAIADGVRGEVSLTITATFRVAYLNSMNEPAAINDSGAVVGSARFGEEWHAAFYDGNSVIDLGTLGSLESSAIDINNLGQIVGTSLTASNMLHAFIWNPDTRRMQDLGTLGGLESGASAINDSGLVVGWSGEHAVIWNDGVMRDLELGPSIAHDINGQGLIAVILLGTQSLPSGSTSRLGQSINEYGETVRGNGSTLILQDRDGVVTEIAAPFPLARSKLVINDCRQIVGTWEEPLEGYLGPGFPFRGRAFLWQDGSFQVLDTRARDRYGSFATDIDESGHVVGSSGGSGVIWTVPSCAAQ